MFTGCKASKGMCMCMGLLSLACISGRKVGLISGRAIKETHVRLPFLCVSRRLLRSRAMEHHTVVVRGWDDGGVVCYGRELCRSTLQCSHVCSTGIATFMTTINYSQELFLKYGGKLLKHVKSNPKEQCCVDK